MTVVTQYHPTGSIIQDLQEKGGQGQKRVYYESRCVNIDGK